jgi:hypothetical protein
MSKLKKGNLILTESSIGNKGISNGNSIYSLKYPDGWVFANLLCEFTDLDRFKAIKKEFIIFDW